MATSPQPQNVEQLLAAGSTVWIKTQTEKTEILGRILDGIDARGILVHRQRGDHYVFLSWANVLSIRPVSEEEYQAHSSS
jgi:hypothetical protein